VSIQPAYLLVAAILNRCCTRRKYILTSPLLQPDDPNAGTEQ